jgi:roadblock/LC7 domain-containing protein
MMDTKTLFAVLIVFSGVIAQEQVDENALFADSSSVVDSAAVVNTQAARDDAKEKNSVGWSGEVNAFVTPSVSRDWFDDPELSGVGFPSRVVANGLFDVRLVKGAKAFVDLEAAYVPVASYDMARSTGMSGADSGTVVNIPEFFIDANYHKKVYVRVGKQVLQWGSCFLWNPTDFVNVERKTFLQKMGHREGTYGLRLHIPYKTLFNFYSFLDANDAATADALAAAAKAEVLVGRTEMSLSMRVKKNMKPMFGFDCSTQLFTVQIAGEVSMRNGEDMNTLDLNDTTITDMGDTWIPRASVNLMKFFPVGGVADRLTISTEFYYNHAGYAPNVFSGGVIDYSRILNTLLAKANTKNDTTTVMGLYEANSYSKYYGMFSASLSRFIVSDMTYTCSVIGNFSQASYMLSTGIDYRSLQNFLFSFYLNAFLGKKNTEYTFSNNALMAQIRTGIVF